MTVSTASSRPEQVVRWHAERDPRCLDLALGPHEALRHRRSGTRKARAISSVVRPPRVRSVSATWASSASAGWQQVKMSSRRSSGRCRRVHRPSTDAAGDKQAELGAQRSVTAEAVDGAVERAVDTARRAGWLGTPSRGQ